MSWNTSDRASRLPHDWPARVRAVKQRAHSRCQWHAADGTRCTRPGTDCDHIVRGDNHNLNNLQWLCAQHHKIKTATENATDRRNRAAMRIRHEQHPGQIAKPSTKTLADHREID